MKKIKVYIDGGARGNPGPAALGVAVISETGQVLKKYGKFLGRTTNNEAEYQALIFALKKLKLIFGKEKIKSLFIEISSDSQLLVGQMTGRYKVINQRIQNLFLQAWNLKTEFKHLSFLFVPREQNKLADKLVNEALDNNETSQTLF